MRAVVEVLLGQLLERAPAQAQVLDRVGQVAGRGRQRQHRADHLELLSALAVDVPLARLGLADDLAVRAGSQAILLAGGHGRGRIAADIPERSSGDAHPDLPRLPAPGHRQQHLQRQPGARPRAHGPRGGPALPGAQLGRSRGCHGPQPRHRARAARVRGRHLRGLRREALRDAERCRAGTLPRLERSGSAGRPDPGRRPGEPPRHGAGDPRARPGRSRPIRGQGPRQRAGVHRAPASRALPALCARGRARRVGAADAAAWGGEAGAADALRSLNPRRDRIVSYVGKLIVSKGVDLLLAAWPLVVARVPEARLVIVGFGTYRETLGRFVEALRRRDLDDLLDIAARGRELEGGPPSELCHLRTFLEGAGPDWLAAAPAAAERVHFTGRLEHDDLPDLLPACEAQVMPSTFPEAFGMVAAEAAACGALPLSAGHSGMAEVTATLAPALEPELRPLLSFEVGPDAVDQIAAKLITWLTLDPAKRDRARAALAAEAARRYSWESVAEGVIAAAQGRLDVLPHPAPPADNVPAP